jgi:hypothetical protein
MSSQRFAVAVVVALGLIAGIAQAGGRARVSILSAPKHLVAGQIFEVAFSVQPEFPMSKSRRIEPTVKAVCGDREITIPAVALKSAGRFKASFAVPAAGEWTITVDSRYCETRMTPLVLTAAPATETHS